MYWNVAICVVVVCRNIFCSVIPSSSSNHRLPTYYINELPLRGWGSHATVWLHEYLVWLCVAQWGLPLMVLQWYSTSNATMWLKNAMNNSWFLPHIRYCPNPTHYSATHSTSGHVPVCWFVCITQAEGSMGRIGSTGKDRDRVKASKTSLTIANWGGSRIVHYDLTHHSQCT